ncbi:MAG: hypothetical protein NT002_05700 [candidate division Zixibacteria bacterium]|nr:hypothetical protein [candidate division Zixibacteria bacterium]
MTEGQEKTFSEMQKAPFTYINQIISGSGVPQDPLTDEDVADRKADRDLRKKLAHRWFAVVAVQLLVMNIVFIIILVKYPIDQWTLRLYVSATLLETWGIVKIIILNLFPKRK